MFKKKIQMIVIQKYIDNKSLNEDAFLDRNECRKDLCN